MIKIWNCSFLLCIIIATNNGGVTSQADVWILGACAGRSILEQNYSEKVWLSLRVVHACVRLAKNSVKPDCCDCACTGKYVSLIQGLVWNVYQ